MVHNLKTAPKYFIDLFNYKKSFELRKNDRGYKIGDILFLREFIDGVYTDRNCSREIVYILKDCEIYGLKKEFVILGIV